MKDFVTRSATLEDLDTLLKFEQALIEAERPFDPTIRKGHIHYYDIRELIESADSEVVVVVDDSDQILASGYALIKKARQYLDHEYYTYLGFMYTLPDFRGQGLNRMVIAALRKWSDSKGISEIRLTVYNGNAAAVKAYEKVGFQKHIVEMRLTTKNSF